MKSILTIVLAMCCFASVSAQTGNYANDLKSAEETIKKNVFKNNFKYLITYSEKTNASFSVSPKTEYRVYFVYDNTNHPVGKFKAYLMNPDKKIVAKYTAVPEDIGQIGVARVQRLKFTTKDIGGKDTQPIKLEASPKATIYIFYKN
ncbi:hypothetical protein [Flavihumibacter profundi]|jgi:hypothetical protein|uniref:hypothetical protein n=1 Tax=Flavihumibacter profundi TaxID=2716883 RepID=UPI001CC4D4A9|nr:hypothetical protein [Flavihumibacter profundi]MBZ5858207.1 hypothetical protein [Flavihumibacter profundi]